MIFLDFRWHQPVGHLTATPAKSYHLFLIWIFQIRYAQRCAHRLAHLPEEYWHTISARPTIHSLRAERLNAQHPTQMRLIAASRAQIRAVTQCRGFAIIHVSGENGTSGGGSAESQAPAGSRKGAIAQRKWLKKWAIAQLNGPRKWTIARLRAARRLVPHQLR